jgi:hypothetical protein
LWLAAAIKDNCQVFDSKGKADCSTQAELAYGRSFKRKSSYHN